MSAKRKRTAYVQLKIRIKEPLRAKVEAEAKRRGISLNAAFVDRIERSLASADSFGGPEAENMARLMAAAFLRGGQRGALARKHPEWSAAEWMADPFAYQAGAEAVADALLLAHPQPFDESTVPGHFNLLFARHAARGGKVEVEQGADIKKGQDK